MEHCHQGLSSAGKPMEHCHQGLSSAGKPMEHCHQGLCHQLENPWNNHQLENPWNTVTKDSVISWKTYAIKSGSVFHEQKYTPTNTSSTSLPDKLAKKEKTPDMTLFSYQEGGVDKSSSKYSTESSFRLFTKKMFRQSFYCHLLHTRH